MNHILLPTDFSESAAYATEIAKYIAKKTGAEILFHHSLNSGLNWGEISMELGDHYPNLKEQFKEAEDQLNDLVGIAEKEGLKATKSLTVSENFEQVTHPLKDKKQDIIIMGSHGRSGLDKFLLGSMTAKMMRVAQTPVLVVKKREQVLPFKTIVFASGLEEDTHGAFGLLLDFAKQVEAENLHFVEVTTPHNFKPTSEVYEEMEAFIKPHNFESIQLHNYNHYNIESGILELAQNVDADLIALATHGRSSLTNLFVDSIPENLVKHSRFPVLSIRV